MPEIIETSVEFSARLITSKEAIVFSQVASALPRNVSITLIKWDFGKEYRVDGKSLLGYFAIDTTTGFTVKLTFPNTFTSADEQKCIEGFKPWMIDVIKEN